VLDPNCYIGIVSPQNLLLFVNITLLIPVVFIVNIAGFVIIVPLSLFVLFSFATSLVKNGQMPILLSKMQLPSCAYCGCVKAHKIITCFILFLC
jgi:hypothetical protein